MCARLCHVKVYLLSGQQVIMQTVTDGAGGTVMLLCKATRLTVYDPVLSSQVCSPVGNPEVTCASSLQHMHPCD